MTTTSPAFSVLTSAPTSSTTPMASCPTLRPLSLCSIVLYGQRSLPQMQAWVTLTRASVGSTRWASGTFSTRTSPAPYMTVARMCGSPPSRDLPCTCSPNHMSPEYCLATDRDQEDDHAGHQEQPRDRDRSERVVHRRGLRRH